MDKNILHIKRPLYQAMIAHLQAHYPLEACGILAGTTYHISHVYPVNNILASPVAYEMDPQQQLEAMIDLESRGWKMSAIFHSHPIGPEQPSATDIAQAYYPDCVYVIVSLANLEEPVVRGFRIENGRYHESEISIE